MPPNPPGSSVPPSRRSPAPWPVVVCGAFPPTGRPDGSTLTRISVKPAGNVLRASSFSALESTRMLTHGAATIGEIADASTPEEIVAWTLRRFAGRNLVVSTSFGMEGCALIDMVARHGVPVPVVYLDTMFLFPETYALRDRMVARYPHLRFENRGATLTPQAQADRFGPELWRRDPDRCCAIRKVEPMRQALAGVDVWVTGLMRSQGGE